MQLTFYGAARQVTGSCFCLEACGKRILIDCGMRQEPGAEQSLAFAAKEIDCALLTHAHIDHSGLLPLLAKQGFAGPIYTTAATADLCGIMLRDSAHIQEFEAEWRNRKGRRAGAAEYIPLYETADAEAALALFAPCRYGDMTDIFPGIQARFTDVGHLLGSATIELWIDENGAKKKLVFSGDIGNTDQPLIRDPGYVSSADYVVMESTYGDRSHGPRPDYLAELSSIIQSTFDMGGNVVIPSFAVGRTQEMLYFIRQIKEEGRIKGHDNFPVYVDSPLAIAATGIFNESFADYYDEEALSLMRRGVNPIRFPCLRTAQTSDESRAINFDEEPKIIISSSGMCDAGRIKHHLKHNLWRKECTILFVGYQAARTLGRTILDGAEKVKLFGEDIQIHARIERLEGVSGHADNNGLLRWLKAIEPSGIQKVFVVHGQDEVCAGFAARIAKETGLAAQAPLRGMRYDLAADRCLDEGHAIETAPKPAAAGASAAAQSGVFRRLLASGKRLIEVIRRNEGGTNRDMSRFSDEIDELCRKWDR